MEETSFAETNKTNAEIRSGAVREILEKKKKERELFAAQKYKRGNFEQKFEDGGIMMEYYAKKEKELDELLEGYELTENDLEYGEFHIFGEEEETFQCSGLLESDFDADDSRFRVVSFEDLEFSEIKKNK